MSLPPAPPPTVSTLSNSNSLRSSVSSPFVSLPARPQPALHHRPSLWEVFPAGRPTTSITHLIVSTRPSNRFIEQGTQDECGSGELVRAGSDEAIPEVVKQGGWGQSIARSLRGLWSHPASLQDTSNNTLNPGPLHVDKGKAVVRGASSSTTSTSPYPTRSTRHAPLLPPVHHVRFAPSHKKSKSNLNESAISQPPLVHFRKPTPHTYECRQQAQASLQSPLRDPYERQKKWKNSWNLTSLPRLGKEYWRYRVLGGTPTYLSPEGSSSTNARASGDGQGDGAGDGSPLSLDTYRSEGRDTTTPRWGRLTKTKMNLVRALRGAVRLGKKIIVGIVNVLTLIVVLPILVPYEIVYGCYCVVQHKRSPYSQPGSQPQTGMGERRIGGGWRRWTRPRGWWREFGEWVQGIFRSEAGDAVLGWLYFWVGTTVLGGVLGLRWCFGGGDV